VAVVLAFLDRRRLVVMKKCVAAVDIARIAAITTITITTSSRSQQQQQQLPAASSPRLQSSDSGSGTKVEDEQAATNTGGTVDISIRGSGNLRRAGSLARSGSPRHESSPRSLAKASSPLGGEDDIAGGGGGGGDSNGSGSVSPQRIDLRASPGQQPPPLPPSPSFRPSVVEREPPPLPSSDTLGELPSHPKSLSLGDSARRASVLSAQSVPSASNDEDDIDFDVHSSESSAGDSHDESDSDADDNAAGDANDEKPERNRCARRHAHHRGAKGLCRC
jgi:hypothetical protein